MAWLLLAFLCALSEAGKDIVSKRGLQVLKPIHVTWAFFIFGTFLLMPFAIFYVPEELSSTFWCCLLSHASLFGIAVYLYMVAISKGELSTTVPLVMFTPLFMLLESPLIKNSTPPLIGVFGVVLIVMGSFLLNIGEISKGVFRPITALVSSTASRMMLGVAFIWSITAYIDKVAVLEVPPVFWAFAEYGLISVLLTGMLVLKADLPWAHLKKHSKTLSLVGTWNFIQVVTYVLAMKFGNPVYVLSIKRTSALMVIGYGWFVYREKDIGEKLFGSIVMLIGVLLISIT